MNQKFRNFLKNFMHALSANVIRLMISVVMTLVLPRILGVEAYSYHNRDKSAFRKDDIRFQFSQQKGIALFLSLTMLLTLFVGCANSKDSEKKLQKVTLNEVAHSIFYAPMYVAIEKDYFKDA